jgi:ethanolamine permease
MIVFSAMISYILQSLSFLRLRWNYPAIVRPFRNPLGQLGAYVVVAISLLTLAYQFADPVYRYGVIGAAIWYAIGLAFFGVYRRHRLVLSPEEEFAVSGGERGVPRC